MKCRQYEQNEWESLAKWKENYIYCAAIVRLRLETWRQANIMDIWCARNLKDPIWWANPEESKLIIHCCIDIYVQWIHFYNRPFCSELQWLFLVRRYIFHFFLLQTAFCLLDRQWMTAAQPTTSQWLTTTRYYSKCCCSTQLSSNVCLDRGVTYSLLERRCSSMIHDRAEHEIFET